MAKKSIKNYTSQTDATLSIARIEKTLVRLGARRVTKDYDPETLIANAIYFEIQHGEQWISFKLPARVKACFNVFMNEVKRPREGTRQLKWEQAERTAWKIIHDWIEAQCAIIELEQADFIQVFLPYAYNQKSQTTFYEQALTVGFDKLLLTS